MNGQTLQSYVDGSWHGSGTIFQDINPAHPDEVVAEVQMADTDLASKAVDAAAEAFRGWRATPAPARGAILLRAGGLLEQRADEVARVLAREEGKALFEALGETKRAVAILRYYAGQTLEPDGDTYPSHSPVTLLYARREPIGVVSAITPYNFPIAIPTWKIAPALAYGNTVVWKPATQVPLTAFHLVSALIDAGIPQGVLNLVFGTGSVVGPVLYEHSAVDAVTFTGSNALGRSIQGEAVQRGKKVQLEMGSKNPAVVLADADLGFAAEQVARGAFLSAGQKCTATSRVIVEQAVMDEFSERLVDLATSWKLGDPLEPDTRIGPLVSAEQLETVMGYLEQAQVDGGQVLAGGDRPADLGAGYYVRPTILQNLPTHSRVVREEIFGPVAALLPASSYKEAIALANDTPFGLSASLFTRDLGKALRFANDIQFGVVKINQESAGLEFQVPFGGMKGSSSGPREQGKVARDFFTQWKTVYMDIPPEEVPQP
jgi:acyl-CoA reductase-like NAD-dependent aldehyde dehydrogenase